MKQFKLSKYEIDYVRTECKGGKVTRNGDNELLVKVKGKPFVRIAVDILESVSVRIFVMLNGVETKFYENETPIAKCDKWAESEYNEWMFKGYPKTFAELNAKQRENVLRDGRTTWIDLTLDEALASLGSALFSEKPVMEINVSGYPKVFNRKVLKAFKVDTKRADEQAAGLRDAHGKRKVV